MVGLHQKSEPLWFKNNKDTLITCIICFQNQHQSSREYFKKAIELGLSMDMVWL
jgi:hypothetical protein